MAGGLLCVSRTDFHLTPLSTPHDSYTKDKMDGMLKIRSKHLLLNCFCFLLKWKLCKNVIMLWDSATRYNRLNPTLDITSSPKAYFLDINYLWDQWRTRIKNCLGICSLSILRGPRSPSSESPAGFRPISGWPVLPHRKHTEGCSSYPHFTLTLVSLRWVCGVIKRSEHIKPGRSGKPVV